MTLRACTEADLPAVLDIERRLFPRDAWSMRMFVDELAGVPTTRYYLVADASTRVDATAGAGARADASTRAGAVGVSDRRAPIGYAGLHVAGGQADVLTIAVHPDHWGRGIGRRLLAALLGEAVRRGATEIFLDVRVDNDRARELYERAGFDRIGLRRGYYYGGIDAVVMRRGLRTGEASEEVAGG